MNESVDGGIAVPAPAKINLYLHVTGRRTDGYHLLDSLVVFAGIHDLIVLRPAESLSLRVEGPFSGAVPEGPDNLVLRAAGRLAEAAGVAAGAAITIVKHLPAAAGLGGGSADAAAALRGLAGLWKLGADACDLEALALELGADVPVCLRGRAAFVGGIGEQLSAAPALPAAWMALVNPGVELATPRVFAGRSGAFSPAARFDDAPSDAAELAAVLSTRDNDLTAAACALAPAVDEVLAALEAAPGALLARMTGSGATCFGLFADPGAANEAAMELAHRHPGWWSKPASLEADIVRSGA